MIGGMVGALLLLAVAPVGAELLAAPRLEPLDDLRLTFEVLPAEEGEPLPEPIRSLEGARLSQAAGEARGHAYLRTTMVFPVSGADPFERVVFFEREGDRLRMLGFHQIRRRPRGPEGATLVFANGGWNPLRGEERIVPPDAYSYLGLMTALEGFVDGNVPFAIHVWVGDEQAVPAEVIAGEMTEVMALGRKVMARHVRVRPRDGFAPEAEYWFEPGGSLVQFRGPADFLPHPPGPPPRIVLRATSSSAQIERILGSD